MLAEARDRLAAGGTKTLLFVDEIHRFNRRSKTCCCPTSRKGIVILVGATTQNPFFAINSALVSRSRIFQFQPLSARRHQDAAPPGAGRQASAGWAAKTCGCDDDALEFLAEVSDGDARRALGRRWRSACCRATERPLDFTRALAEESVQRKAIEYDRTGDAHYDAASALIKSMRGSDPDAAIYWLARMLEAGEDVALPRPADRDLRQRGRRQRRPARAAVGRGRDAGHASSSACPSASCPWPRPSPTWPGAAIERRDRGDRRGPRDVTRRPSAAGARASCATAITRPPNAWATARLSVLATTAPDAISAQDYLGVDREYYRPVDRGLERRIGRTAEDDPQLRLREARQPKEPDAS